MHHTAYRNWMTGVQASLSQVLNVTALTKESLYDVDNCIAALIEASASASHQLELALLRDKSHPLSRIGYEQGRIAAGEHSLVVIRRLHALTSGVTRYVSNVHARVLRSISDLSQIQELVHQLGDVQGPEQLRIIKDDIRDAYLRALPAERHTVLSEDVLHIDM
jgi:hypothetical protein